MAPRLGSNFPYGGRSGHPISGGVSILCHFDENKKSVGTQTRVSEKKHGENPEAKRLFLCGSLDFRERTIAEFMQSEDDGIGRMGVMIMSRGRVATR